MVLESVSHPRLTPVPKNKRYFLIFLSFCSLIKSFFHKVSPCYKAQYCIVPHIILNPSPPKPYHSNMSIIFSRLNVLTPEVHDAEAANPSPPNVICTRNLIFPVFPSRNPPDVTQDIDDEDKVSSKSSDGQKKSSTPEWKKCRTCDDLAALQLREKLKSMEAKCTNRFAGFRVNSQVYTTNALITVLSEKVPPGKSKKGRLPLFGTIVKRSKFYPRFWLVNSYDGRSFYVILNLLRLGCQSSPSHKFKRDKSNMLQMDKINKTIKNNKETILTDILLSKAQFMLIYPPMMVFATFSRRNLLG